MKKIFKSLILATLISPVFVFADLPKEILADKYLIEATTELSGKNFQEAIKKFHLIEELNIEMPENFYYFYAQTTYQIDDFFKTKENIEQYLKIGGRNSKFYKELLNLLIELEKNLKEEKIKTKDDNSYQIIKSYKNKIISKENYENNILTSLYLYKNGILSGLQKEFYPTGEIKSKVSFEEGLPISTQEYFLPNQQKEKDREFKNYLNGEYTDIYKATNNLILKKETYIKNELVETENNTYSEAGLLLEKEITNTKIPFIKQEKFNEKGESIFSINIINGKEEKLNEKGEKVKDIFYEGLKIIKEIEYTPNSKYQKVIEFNADNKKIHTTEFLDDKKDGKEVIYDGIYEDKRNNIVKTYELNKLIKTEYYDNNGDLSKNEILDNNEIIETYFDKTGKEKEGKITIDKDTIKEYFELKNGKKIGIYKKYDNFLIIEETEYKNGLKDGIMKIYENQKLKETKLYQNNKYIEKSVENKTYYPNGEVKSEYVLEKNGEKEELKLKQYDLPKKEEIVKN